MPTFVERTGVVYGDLKVLRRVPAPQHLKAKNVVYWECLCESTVSGKMCGATVVIPGIRLGYGTSTACSNCGRLKAARSMRGRPSPLLRHPPGLSRVYGNYKCNYPDMTLTKDEFLALSQLPCHYCGRSRINTAFIQGRDANEWLTADQYFRYNGIDRLSNDKGHTIENSVPCCGPCNIAKGNRSAEEYIGLCSAVVLHRGVIREGVANASKE